MPNYDFINKETGDIKEYTMSYKDLDKFKENNPHLSQLIGTPMIVGGHGDRVKTDDGFKEVLSKIGENHKGSHLHKDSVKDSATKRIIKKHMDIQSKTK